MYVALVAVAGVAGYFAGTLVSGLSAPRFPFLVPFLPTSVGFAAYDALTTALVPGVPLVLVVYVLAGLDNAA